MKKARIMLVAIATFGIIGGAVAFKAKDAYSVTIYTGPNSLACTNPVLNATTTASGGAITFATFVKGAVCTTQRTIHTAL
jgi:hypothetical protein